MVTRLLIPETEYAQLSWLDHELAKKTDEISTTSKALQSASHRLDQEQTVARFLESGSEKMLLDGAELTAQRIKILRLQREEAARKLALLQEEISKALDKKTRTISELSTQKTKREGILAKLAEIKLQKYRSILDPDEPLEVHMVRHLVHEKRCPFCDADLKTVISERESGGFCIFCGNEIAGNVPGIDELNNAAAVEQKNEEQINEEIAKRQSEIEETDKHLVTLHNDLSAVEEDSRATSKELAGLKGSEDLDSEINVIRRELTAVKHRVAEGTKECERLSAEIERLKMELGETERLREKGRAIAQSKMKEIFGKVSGAFTDFVREATNGELDAELSPDMVASLRGRKIYAADDVSQFERSILDMAFRIAAYYLPFPPKQVNFCPSCLGHVKYDEENVYWTCTDCGWISDDTQIKLMDLIHRSNYYLLKKKGIKNAFTRIAEVDFKQYEEATRG